MHGPYLYHGWVMLELRVSYAQVLDYALHYACAMAARRLGMAMLGLRAGHNWIMPGLCMEYVWIRCGLCEDYAWIMHGLCKDYVWSMHGSGVEYAWIRYGLCMDENGLWKDSA